MDILAKPWNGLIMATLQEAGAQRFSELTDKIDTIGDRMLAERLRELEARGLLTRAVEEGPPVRVRYELTDVGYGFQKVAAAIGDWGAQLKDVPAADATHKRPVRPARATKAKPAPQRRRA